jgi:membrane associated rhomboid family serine protease
MLTVQVIAALGIGFLPTIDNFAHVGGFVAGLLAGPLFLPKIYYSKADKARKTIFIFVSIPILVVRCFERNFHAE